MTAVSKVGRQDPAYAKFRSKLEKSIIQPQLTVCFYTTVYTQLPTKMRERAVPVTVKPFTSSVGKSKICCRF